METMTGFIFLGSKITADGDCSHEIKRCLLLGRKAMTNLDSVLKSKDITLPIKVPMVKGMIFPAVMHGCESWTIKKEEQWRTDALELWCWRRFLRVPWIARRSNQSILKEINPDYSLEGLMLRLKLQYFGHLMQIADSLWNTLVLGKIEGRWRRGKQDDIVGWHHQIDGQKFEQTPGDSEGREGKAWRATVHGVPNSQTWLRLNNNRNRSHIKKDTTSLTHLPGCITSKFIWPLGNKLLSINHYFLRYYNSQSKMTSSFWLVVCETEVTAGMKEWKTGLLYFFPLEFKMWFGERITSGNWKNK